MLCLFPDTAQSSGRNNRRVWNSRPLCSGHTRWVHHAVISFIFTHVNKNSCGEYNLDLFARLRLQRWPPRLPQTSATVRATWRSSAWSWRLCWSSASSWSASWFPVCGRETAAWTKYVRSVRIHWRWKSDIWTPQMCLEECFKLFFSVCSRIKEILWPL